MMTTTVSPSLAKRGRLACLALCLLSVLPARTQTAAPAGLNSIVSDDRTEVLCQSMTQASVKRTRTVKILNRKGMEAALFVCPCDNFNSLQRFSGVILNAAGNVVRKIKKSDLQRTEYSAITMGSDDYLYYYECDYPTFPFSITYEWEMKKNNGIVYYPSFSPQDSYHQSVERASYRMEQSAGQTCRYRPRNAEGANIEVKESTGPAGQQIVEVTARQMPVIPSEPFSPPKADLMPCVYFAPTTFKFDKSEGTMNDWKTFGQWQWDLLAGRDALPEQARAKVRQIAEGRATDREKVKAVYDYLGQTTRYVSVQLGIGGWQPIAAANVCQVGFGDCKGLSNYARAMLGELGIASTYTVISTTNERLLPDFASLTQMNHAILQVPLPGDTLWLECTNPTLPFGYVHEDIAGHDALLVEPAGGRIYRLPTYPDSLNTQVNRAIVTLSPDASARIENTCTSRLFQYENEIDIRYLKPDKQKDRIRSGITLSQADVQAFSIDERKTAEPTSVISYTATTNLYGQKTGSRLFVPVNVLRRRFSVPTSARRVHPIRVGYGYLDTDSVCLRMPQGYAIEGIPKPVSVESKFGSFHSEVSVDGQDIWIVQRLHLRKGVYAPGEYEEFIRFRKQVGDQYSSRVVLKKSEPKE